MKKTATHLIRRLCRGWTGRLPTVTRSGLRRGAASIWRSLRPWPWRKEMRLPPRRYQQQADQDTTDGNQSAANDADWLEYGAAELHRRKRRSFRPARYSVEAEFMQPPGWISRTSEGKFVLDEDSQQPSHPSPIYYQAHPPSAYPPSPVVESGVYRIGGDRTDRPRPTPILRRELSPQLGFPAVDSSARQLALRSSSPAPLGLLLSPSLTHFSDLSSVRNPSSAERSGPSGAVRISPEASPSHEFGSLFPNAAVLSPSVSQSRYIRELPALLPLHQQLPLVAPQSTIRTQVQVHSPVDRSSVVPPPLPARPKASGADFRLLLNTSDPAGRHIHSSMPPPFRPPPAPSFHGVRLPYTISYPPPTHPADSMGVQRPLATSSPPRSRHPVSSGDFSRQRARRSPLTIAVRLSPSGRRDPASSRSGLDVEYSPQSQSSSSGFDSKNTSQQNQSSQSGSASGQSSSQLLVASTWSPPPPLSGSSARALEAHYVNWPVSGKTPAQSQKLPVRNSLLDASVDNHYEFDTTQSPNETGPDASASLISTATASSVPVAPIPPPAPPVPPVRRKPVAARYENIEARVQAMKEEFQEYRKRRARGLLESAC